MLGQQGTKNTLQDLAEAKASLERAIQIEGKTLKRWADQMQVAAKTQEGEVAAAIVESLKRSTGEAKAQVSVDPNGYVPTATVPSVEGSC